MQLCHVFRSPSNSWAIHSKKIIFMFDNQRFFPQLHAFLAAAPKFLGGPSREGTWGRVNKNVVLWLNSGLKGHCWIFFHALMSILMQSIYCNSKVWGWGTRLEKKNTAKGLLSTVPPSVACFQVGFKGNTALLLSFPSTNNRYSKPCWLSSMCLFSFHYRSL